MALSSANRNILDSAVKAVHERIFFAQYPEHPKAYGEAAAAAGKAAFEKLLDQRFTYLKQTNEIEFAGEETSPYTNEHIGITYPIFDPENLIIRSARAFSSWKKVPLEDRANVLLDCLEHLKERFFEIAYATMHTTGQSFVMSFQASGPHSNDRALEALAIGYEELTRFPEKVVWEKPMGKGSVKLEKTYKPVPKGIGLVIGCSTFPIWNSIPGIFASLITGNSVVVKPHPKSVLPIAIVVSEMQRVFDSKGFDPLTIQLAADTSDRLITKALAEHDLVKIVDYTGSSAFGEYIESLHGKSVFTEKAGVNSVILDSTSDMDAMLQNLAFSVSLYSGQMCTAPQNFFIPEDGISVNGQQVAFDDVVEALKKGIRGLADHPKMGAGTLGAIQSEQTLKRIRTAPEIGARVLLESGTISNPDYENARICTPIVLEVEAKDIGIYENEMFGPIVMVIKTKNTKESVKLAREMAQKHGAITCAAYCQNDETAAMIEEEMENAYAPVSLNLEGPIWVNQHAAFSDFHVTGGNPAGNASFTNPDYVNRRFVWVGHRKSIS